MKLNFTPLVGIVVAVGLSACGGSGDEGRLAFGVSVSAACEAYPEVTSSGEYLGTSVTIDDTTIYFGPDQLTELGASTFCEARDGDPEQRNEDEEEEGEGE